MNNEIKEILKILKKCEFGACITKHNSRVLLDYITNLQDQLHQASLNIQELIERDIECPSWCDKLTNLQEENRKLKEALCKDNIVSKNKYDYLKRQKESLELELFCIKDYKSRIDKAIEYIKNNWYSKNTRNIEELHSLGDWRLDLLEILGDKGEDK